MKFAVEKQRLGFEPKCVTVQMKASETNFHVVLYTANFISYEEKTEYHLKLYIS